MKDTWKKIYDVDYSLNGHLEDDIPTALIEMGVKQDDRHEDLIPSPPRLGAKGYVIVTIEYVDR